MSGLMRGPVRRVDPPRAFSGRIDIRQWRSANHQGIVTVTSTAVSARTERRLGFLNNPITFTISVPLLTALGAASTIIAPILLNTIEFGLFALMLSLFQYVSLFDLGLSRLCDKWLTQSRTDTSDIAGELLSARLIVGIGLGAVAILSYFVASGLTAIAIFAGTAAMLSNGPISNYRARSRVAALTLSTVAMQFGMSLPRLAGLLADGVRGAISGCAIWFGVVAIVLHLPFSNVLRPINWRRLLAIFVEATPLFVLSTVWLLYQLANRWFSWMMSTPEDYGLFAFGANLVLIGLGIIGTVSQTYYPRHLATADGSALRRELRQLGGIAVLGCALFIPFCRWALPKAFVHFAHAGASTSALVFSGLPLCLSAWLIPLVIARTERPVRDAVVLFGTGLITLSLLMRLFYSIGGLDGQAWANTPPAILLLGMLLYLVVTRQRLLSCNFAVWLLASVVSLEILFAGGWYFTFG